MIFQKSSMICRTLRKKISMAKSAYLGGICGMGMAPLAILLKGEDMNVCGFDDNPDNRVVELLKSHNISVSDKINENIKSDLFVISTALASRFPEKNKILRRGECFAKFCESRKLVAIVGSHGKTTVTNMCANAIHANNLNAGWMVGAMPMSISPARHCEKENFFFSEIDESDGTIENFSPEICCALNYDLDHTYTYNNNNDLKQMFVRLFSRTKKLVLIPSNDKVLLECAKESKKPFEIVDVSDSKNFFDIDKKIAESLLKIVFGNSFNPESLDSFGGTFRRQEILKDTKNFIAIADYAHHPNEVEAFLNWLNEKYDLPKVIFFQPHRYTRTKRFFIEFREALEKANTSKNQVYILPVYPASEPFDENACSEKIAENSFLKNILFADMQDIIKNATKNEKVCIAFIGAGNIYFEAKKII